MSQPNTSGQMNTMFKFNELPTEIRCMIYELVFKSAQVEISLYDGENYYSVGQILRKIQDNKASILLAADWCLNEGLDILAAATTINFYGNMNPHDRSDKIAQLDKDFLRHVKTIQIHPDAFIRANRSLLPKLKTVKLAHQAFSEMDMSSFVHSLKCHSCGDSDGFHCYYDLTDWSWDWDWKRKQLLHLAEEYGWEIDLLLFFETARRAPRFEFDYDMTTKECRGKRYINGGRVDLEGSEVNEVLANDPRLFTGDQAEWQRKEDEEIMSD